MRHTMKHFNDGDKYERHEGTAERSELCEDSAVEQLWTTTLTTKHRRHAHTHERKTKRHDDGRRYLQQRTTSHSEKWLYVFMLYIDNF